MLEDMASIGFSCIHLLTGSHGKEVVRSQEAKKTASVDPDNYVPRPALSAAAKSAPPHSTQGVQGITGPCSYHWEADRVDNISSSLYMCPSAPLYMGPPQVPVYPSTSTAGPSNPSPNPFYLKFIAGNIRICQGCRQSLRTSTGSIPDPPYNLVVARSEKRPYRDSSGDLVTPSSYSNAHYHVAISCITRVEPTFHPSMLKIPSDIACQLGWDHKNFLFTQMGLAI